jgi:hypothetical protein
LRNAFVQSTIYVLLADMRGCAVQETFRRSPLLAENSLVGTPAKEILNGLRNC